MVHAVGFFYGRSVSMALFNNKEIESLQAENMELKNKIVHLKNEIMKYESRLAKYISPEHFKKHFQSLSNYATDLEEQIAALETRPHNERGAGRKHKATSEQREHILSLFSSGVSQNKIARIITEQTGEKWNKTTVRNIIIASKN